LFLLIELVERARDPAADILAVTMEAYGETEEAPMEDEEVGVAFPAAVALLGGAFAICALLLAGLPPFSGFIAKFAILAGLLNPALIVNGHFAPGTWLLVTLLVLSGLAALVTMTRMGIHTFWVPTEATVPRVRLVEAAPVAGLLLVCLGLTIAGGPVMRYMGATAESLAASRSYVDSVLSKSPVLPAGSRKPEAKP
jgi:multicomponent K+:H+ antiporter subunit D